jgi:hypothetical protein
MREELRAGEIKDAKFRQKFVRIESKQRGEGRKNRGGTSE